MCIDGKRMASEEFIKNEVKTLGIIQGQTSIATHFRDLHQQASYTYSLYEGKKPGSIPFRFDCELKMEIEKRKQILFIEAEVRQNYSFVTYALCMCEDTEQKTLMRKFHFDYDPQVNASASKKPKYHLQYGGKATPSLKKNDISTKDLQDWLSVPRLSFTPINLALFLDIVFNEFPSEHTQRVIENKEWREMIKTNEENVLLPYFRNVNQFISSGHKSYYLFRDFVYGK